MPDRKFNLRALLAERLPQLSDDELDSLEAVVYEEIELRAGNALTDLLTTEQAEQFGFLVEADDEAAASAFLDSAIPNHSQIVIEIVQALIQETAQRIEKADEEGNS